MIPRLPEVQAVLARPQGARPGEREVDAADALPVTDPSDETSVATDAAGGDTLAQLDAIDTGKPFTKARDVGVALSARHMRGLAGWPDKTEDAVIPANIPDRLTCARRIPEGLQAGTVRIDCRGDTDAASPFGGVRASGYGREMGRAAIELHSRTRSVWVA